MTITYTTLILSSAIFGYFLYTILKTLSKKKQLLLLPPGPRPWPILGNLPHVGDKPHRTMAALAAVYGPLLHLKMGFVHVVVAASSSVAEEFLKTHDANFSSRPFNNSGAKHIAYEYQDLVFAPYGPRWRMLRKICSLHLFSAKALNDFRYVRQEEVGILTRVLAGGGHAPVNLGQVINLCVTNAIGRVMIGKRVFGDHTPRGDDPKANEFKSMVTELMVLAGEFNVSDFIPALEWLDLQGIAAKMKKLHARFDAFLNTILEEHKSQARGEGAKGDIDFLTKLLSLEDDGDGGKLTDTEIKALLLNMFTAGTDTSSSTVEWAIAELLRNAKIMSRAREELDRVVGRDRLVTESDLSDLTFLQAVIKETFRLHPSTPLSLPRVASETCQVSGYTIPKDTILLVNVWAIARDPSTWANPLEFRPERFLPGGEKEKADIRGNNFGVIPFGAGRRICPGMSLGIRMVQLVTATLVHAFDWDLPDGETAVKLDMAEAYGLTLQRAVPLMVHAKPRLSPHAYGA